MSPLPKRSRRLRPGVYIAPDGRLYLRAEVQGPDGRKRPVGPRLAAEQPSGRSVEERRAAEVEAERELLTRIAAVRRGDYAAAAAPVWTVRAFAEYVWERNPAKSAPERAQRAQAWLDVIGEQRLDTVTTTDVERAWEAVLALPGRDGTAPRAYGTLGLVRVGMAQVFNRAAERGLTDGNPFRLAMLPMPADNAAPREAFSLAQIAGVFAHLPPRLRAPYLLQWACGMRNAEAWLARWEYVDQVEAGTRYTISADAEKTSTTRWLILPAGLVAVLEQHRLEYGGPRSGPLFPSSVHPDRPFGRTHGVKAWSQAADKAGLSAGSHDLRANWEQLADRLGVRPFVRDVITGHTPKTMGDRYNAATLVEVRDALALVWAHIVEAIHESVPQSVPFVVADGENRQ